jgi:hypothetical protein
MACLIQKKINYNHNFYISNLDLINKYNLDEKKKIPCLNMVIIEFSLTKFLNSFTQTHKTEFNSEIQIKSILILYLLIFNVPFINYKKLKLEIKKNFKVDKRHFVLKATLNDKILTNEFLIKMFFEEKGNIVFDLETLKNRKFKNSNNFIYTTHLTIQNFTEIDILFNRILNNINSNELFFKINFSFFCGNIKADFKKIIRNLPFFWINGRVV